MKAIYISLLAMIISITSNSQSCLPGGIEFSNQSQIDNFQLNYPNCHEIEGSVLISGNGIINLLGLSVLTTIGGDLVIRGNHDLPNLNGLNGIIYIGGYLEISQNQSLTTLTGLENLTWINGWLGIYMNPPLLSLAALQALTHIGGGISITQDHALTSLAGLENIDAGSISFLEIFNNSSLSNCEVQSICNYLANPNGEVIIFRNLPGCNSPMEIANMCGITLSCLPYGYYFFQSQPEIDSFQTDYPGCTDLIGDVTIMGEDITNLDGLNSITSIGGTLWIGHWLYGGNPNLSNLTGLSNLVYVGESLGVYDNFDSLKTLNGLNNLILIGGDMYISGNLALNSLSGIDNIIANSIDNLHIEGNLSLSTCDVESICNYLSDPNGTVVIQQNNIGCNSQQELEEICGVGLEDNCSSQIDLIIYPNPISTSFTLEISEPADQSELTILNTDGQLLDHYQITGPRTIIDISKIPPGIYFVRYRNHNEIRMSKIVKY